MAKETQIKLTKTRYRLGCLGVTLNLCFSSLYPWIDEISLFASFFRRDSTKKHFFYFQNVHLLCLLFPN